MKKGVAQSSGGTGFFGLLTIVLIVLKLLGKISCSWWIVFSPLIVGFILLFIILLLVGILLSHK